MGKRIALLALLVGRCNAILIAILRNGIHCGGQRPVEQRVPSGDSTGHPTLR